MEYLKIEEDQDKLFVYLDAASVSLQALANSIVWGTSPQFFKLMKRKIRGGNHPNEEEALINH
ncbi:hypothetical protein PPL_05380 [Heterostelium album PN500]|uniref:Uncharacterized protein n=1 Tax=Heterostelium pallidum (strain ATCC 26659 / Pp 5 / PN500) TaxID=670386 RepID=D3BA08_HETP5|nr:hypothetical protein PPL_05380 [Heterostelium album PN500]EFA81395.1 hypothetical protein PPL_05380 [Heterostelium album PN500]|eukprot:XP_020433513.1 hypothetical protein PPL_05380 [Heterostelium album PN500]